MILIANDYIVTSSIASHPSISQYQYLDGSLTNRLSQTRIWFAMHSTCLSLALMF